MRNARLPAEGLARGSLRRRPSGFGLGSLRSSRRQECPRGVPQQWINRAERSRQTIGLLDEPLGDLIVDHFHYENRVLHCESVPLPDLAKIYGTPLYVYSTATLLHHLKQVQDAFASAEPLICYSLKTNGNIHIGRLMREHGAGFDVTSGGELFRALACGGIGSKIVFAGVGKTDDEIRYAFDNNVAFFNVESDEELLNLGEVARSCGKVASAALRVNPDLPPKTHAKTDTSVKGVKFGLDIDTVLEVAQKMVGNPNVRIVGLHMHLGSPILSTSPYQQGVEKGLGLIDQLRRQ